MRRAPRRWSTSTSVSMRTSAKSVIPFGPFGAGRDVKLGYRTERLVQSPVQVGRGLGQVRVDCLANDGCHRLAFAALPFVKSSTLAIGQVDLSTSCGHVAASVMYVLQHTAPRPVRAPARVPAVEGNPSLGDLGR